MISTSQLFEYTKKISVLFVEDNEELQIQMGDIFRTLFKDIVIASNGQMGLDIYSEKHNQRNEHFDLVITDINMPILNGIDMIKEIYKIVPDQQVIVTSAYSDSECLIELLNIGISSFLMKPITTENMTQSFFNISKAIINEKLIQENNREIKSLNISLSMKTQELKNANEMLLEKNIALEKSMRIIEGLHHSNQLSKKVDLDIKHDVKLEVPFVKEMTKDIDVILDTKNNLKNIELIICNISMKYHFDGIENDLLQRLSNEINEYSDTIPQEDIFAKLKKLLKQLADTVYHRPECTKEKELNKIFTIVESFFYIYSKWQDEWKNIDKQRIALSASSIENEIETIISLWTCKKI